jgi:glycosyltransferase involved in cell wall biosynthesis
MTATLRIVLDREPVGSDLSEAATELARGLVATTPAECSVEAVVPAGAPDPQVDVPGLASVTRLSLGARELRAAWQLGVPAGGGGGLLHATSLAAPLVRHDRVHDHDQTVVTAWDLDAWERPGELARGAVLAQRAFLKRAVRFADAVVVPTHATAERLAEIARLGDRVRVIPGAPPEDFRVPADEVGRRRSLGLPEGFVLMSGSAAPSGRLSDGFRAVALAMADLPVVVIDAPEGEEPAIVDAASAAGLPETRVHVRPHLDRHDRAAVLGAAVAYLAPSELSGFPWRLVEALRLGVPTIAAASQVHREIVAEGGMLVDLSDGSPGEALSAALAAALASAADGERWGVLAGDRGRAFSWAGAGEKVWQLHADL